MKGASGQHLLAKLQDHMEIVQCGCREAEIALRWVPGHGGICDNERVDEEAKRAYGGDSSPVFLLPKACGTHSNQSISSTRRSPQEDQDKVH